MIHGLAVFIGNVYSIMHLSDMYIAIIIRTLGYSVPEDEYRHTYQESHDCIYYIKRSKHENNCKLEMVLKHL